MREIVNLQESLASVKRGWNILRGRDTWQATQIQCPEVHLGNEHARWCLCPTWLTPQSIVYSFGVGEEISFDLELIRQFGACVHAFDPTPRSIQWVRAQATPPEFVFHEYGVADFDGNCQFMPPENPAHVSHSVIRKSDSRRAIQAPVHRLTTIMEKLGHDHIDLLKMDIEGAEYGVVADLLSCNIRIDQLLVEFHHRWPELGVQKTKLAIRELNRAGYRVFHISPTGEEYSFKKEGPSDGVL
jgi:FkbM family methyltransferase